MNNPCKNCANRACALSLLAKWWDACVDSKFTLYPQMRSSRITRKRFEKILKALRFPRNMLGAVCKAAIRDYGSYGNAYKYSTTQAMHERATLRSMEREG